MIIVLKQIRLLKTFLGRLFTKEIRGLHDSTPCGKKKASHSRPGEIFFWWFVHFIGYLFYTFILFPPPICFRFCLFVNKSVTHINSVWFVCAIYAIVIGVKLCRAKLVVDVSVAFTIAIFPEMGFFPDLRTRHRPENNNFFLVHEHCWKHFLPCWTIGWSCKISPKNSQMPYTLNW